MTKTIKVTNEKATGTTMVWYLGDNGAVVADITKEPAGWAVKFRDKRSYCNRTKAEALAIAKRWVKATLA